MVLELGVSNSEALEIIRVAKRTSRSPSPQLTPHAHPPRSTSGLSQLAGCSALELLQREQAEGSIVTFCAAIDEMLGGGVALGKLTEFCGAPGLGKTQLRCVCVCVCVCVLSLIVCVHFNEVLGIYK